MASEGGTDDGPSGSTWARAGEAQHHVIVKAVVEELESQGAKLERDLHNANGKLAAQESVLASLKAEKEKMQSSLDSQSTELAKIKNDYKQQLSKNDGLEHSQKTNAERMDRLDSEADSLREEISRLTKLNVEAKTRITEMEALTKSSDSEAVPLRYEVQRLSSEVDSLTAHSNWFKGELQAKNEELASSRTESATQVAQLRTDLDAATEERERYSGETTNLRRQLDQSTNEVERKSQELRDTKMEAANAEADLRSSLEAAERLSNMQQEQLQRLQQKHDSLASQFEAQKEHALVAEKEGNHELQLRRQDLEAKTKQILEDQAKDYEQQLDSMKEQLELANRRCKQAEDGLLLANEPAQRASRTAQRRALPAITQDEGGNDDEPLNLTELYGRVAETEDALGAETLRRKKAEIRFNRLAAEIEANAPVLHRQREEYELAMKRQEEYKKRLDASLDEANAVREESRDLQAEVRRLSKRNNELDGETAELAKQVQALLVSRSSASGTAQNEVVEMQNTNQRLLKEHRRLTATVAELEKKLQTDDLQTKVNSYESSLATLREDRQRQEVMVESIVQQRDLYRALLAKQDSKLLGSEGDESSALQIVQQQSERTKSLEQHKNQIEGDLEKARAELALVEKDKENASERVARYESLNGELTTTVSRLQAEVTKNKAEAARGDAEATFHREKCNRLEETLQRAKDEITLVAASKSELQRINAEMQKSVSKAKSDASRLESELQQTQTALRLAETRSETAKAAEQRISSEAQQLRTEISRQGALIESIQRIEASLSAKYVADEEAAKSQATELAEKLAAEESKRATEMETANDKLADQDAKIKDLEQRRVEATKEGLESKKEALAANAELQKLTKKCSQLETQLRLAKKKLGETGDEEDVEAELRSKVATISEELSAARSEVETVKERSSRYEKLAKENEAAVAEQTTALQASKKAYLEEVENLKGQLEIASTETAKAKEVITELTNDLAAQRSERAKELEGVTARVVELEGQVQKYQTEADSALNRYSQLEAEVVVLRTEVTNSQNNYERELALHATARTSLRAAREESEAEMRLRKSAQEQVASLKGELAEQQSLLEREKASMESTLKEYETNLQGTRDQNTLLHGQLEKIGEQIEELQAGKGGDVSEGAGSDGSTEEAQNLRKTVAELREVVKFVRSEKDIVVAQLDAARRAAERERAACSVAKRSLDEARAELKVLSEGPTGSGALSDVESLKTKLATSEEQTQLLGESNAHLREEVEKLQKTLTSTKQDLGNARASAQPSEERVKQVETEKAGLVAEKESLLREINDWKGRVQSLVSKFNQVDPAEHAKVVAKLEATEKDVKALEAKKKESDDECKRIRTLASKASTQLMQNKSLAEAHSKTIAKLTSEKEALAKAQKEGGSKKEVSELKQKVTKLEAERATEKIQLSGANGMNEKLRERLRQFQKTIMDLKKKDTALEKELKDAKAQLEKEAAPAEATPAWGSAQPTPAAAELPAQTKTSEESLPDGAEGSASDPTDKATVPVHETAKEQATEPPATEKKAMPRVPPGGFRFGPSPSETAEDAGAQKEPVAKKATPAEPAPSSSETSKPSGQPSKKRPAETSNDTVDTKKTKAPETKPSEKPSETSQSAGEQVVREENKASESSAESPKHAATRRASGESKEMSMKEKLMEKKRKLKLAMEKKKQKLAQETKDEKEEPAAKKSKTQGDTENDAKLELSASTDSVEPDVKTQNDDKKDEGGDKPDADDAGEGSKEQQATSTPSPGLNAGAVPFNPFGSSASSQPTFGSISGVGTSSSGFGQGTKPTGFGQPASGGGFGTASASSGGSVFGKKTETANASAASGSGSFGGAAFLNIKPPGSSTAPPQFSFGTKTGSITLPTPANPSPQTTMFNAFSSTTPSTSFSAKPLFGTKKEEPKDESKEEGEEGEEEEGEMAEAGQAEGN